MRRREPPGHATYASVASMVLLLTNFLKLSMAAGGGGGRLRVEGAVDGGRGGGRQVPHLPRCRMSSSPGRQCVALTGGGQVQLEREVDLSNQLLSPQHPIRALIAFPISVANARREPHLQAAGEEKALAAWQAVA